MVKWLVAGAALLIAITYLLFQFRDTATKTANERSSDTPSFGEVTRRRDRPPAPSTSVERGRTDTAAPEPQQATEESPSSGLSTAELNARLDQIYPARFYKSIATHCDPKGLDPDASAHLEYGLRVLRGEVLATNVRVVTSTLGDAALEQCIVAALEQTRWRDDDMPDLEEDQDFYYRVRAQKKHLPAEEQETFGKGPGSGNQADEAGDEDEEDEPPPPAGQ